MNAGCRFLHYYTMNLETAVILVLKGLNIINTQKGLPFKGCSSERQKEDVRPIFWANKPESYIQKTQTWDEFPNGRWGDSRSPAFNNDDGFVSYSKKFRNANVVEKKKMWGEQCRSMKDLSRVFVAYITGKIRKFPFCEGTIALETEDINS
jgi:methylenetetrahydrofolate reductase (NADPH)